MLGEHVGIDTRNIHDYIIIALRVAISKAHGRAIINSD